MKTFLMIFGILVAICLVVIFVLVRWAKPFRDENDRIYKDEFEGQITNEKPMNKT